MKRHLIFLKTFFISDTTGGKMYTFDPNSSLMYGTLWLAIFQIHEEKVINAVLLFCCMFQYNIKYK